MPNSLLILKQRFLKRDVNAVNAMWLMFSSQMRLMGECRSSIDAVKRAEGELTEDEDEMPGLTNPTNTDTQSAGQ